MLSKMYQQLAEQHKKLEQDSALKLQSAVKGRSVRKEVRKLVENDLVANETPDFIRCYEDFPKSKQIILTVFGGHSGSKLSECGFPLHYVMEAQRIEVGGITAPALSGMISRISGEEDDQKLKNSCAEAKGKNPLRRQMKMMGYRWEKIPLDIKQKFSIQPDNWWVK